jgi:Asp-tRNA(Asn)/Glu-tRNA(Gln) amidotransferase A subunit family amidase
MHPVDMGLNDGALAQGATPGKLQGVPVTIKINIDVKGQANSLSP